MRQADQIGDTGVNKRARPFGQLPVGAHHVADAHIQEVIGFGIVDRQMRPVGIVEVVAYPSGPVIGAE